MSRQRLFLILLVLGGAGAVVGAQEENGWRIEVATPEGFNDLRGSGSGRRFDHRLRQAQERSVIDLGVIVSEAADEEAFLAGEKGDDELGPEPERELTLAGERARSRVFLGETELVGRRLAYERLVAVRKLDDRRFLRLVATLYHADERPSDRLRQLTRRALRDILDSLKVEKDAGAPEVESDAVPRTAPAAEEVTPFPGADVRLVLPVRFVPPRGWDVRYDDFKAAGLDWVVATPLGRDGSPSPYEDIAVALRVTIFGCVPELIGVDDQLERACAFVGDDYRLRYPGGEIERLRERLFGQALGRIHRFRAKEASGDAGLVLVIVADAGLVIAEFRCRASDIETYQATGEILLESFELAPDRSRRTLESGPFRVEVPAGFAAEEVGTEDDSRAFVLSGADAELFLRSYALPRNEVVDGETLRRLGAMLFGKTLGLAAEAEILRALPLVVPGAEEGLQHFELRDAGTTERRAVDLFAFRKRDALHFAVLSTSDGLIDHARGRLLETICDMAGPGPEPAPTRMGEDGLLSRRVCLRYFDPRPFGDFGDLVGSGRGRLILDARGRALLEWRAPGGGFLREGNYRKVGDQLIVNLGEATPRAFTWSAEERLAIDSEGRRWYPSSSF